MNAHTSGTVEGQSNATAGLDMRGVEGDDSDSEFDDEEETEAFVEVDDKSCDPEVREIADLMSYDNPDKFDRASSDLPGGLPAASHGLLDLENMTIEASSEVFPEDQASWTFSTLSLPESSPGPY